MEDLEYNEIEPRLEDFSDYRTPVTLSKIVAPHACTFGECSPCHVFGQLPVWNELLSQIHLQLVEYSPGRLSLVSLDRMVLDYAVRSAKLMAAKLAYWLIRRHQCLEAVWITYPYSPLEETYEGFLISTLHPFSDLRSLKLAPEERFIPTLSSISLPRGLEEAEFRILSAPNGFVKSLCSFIAKSTSLKKVALLLWGVNCAVHCTLAPDIWKSLTKNGQLQALSVASNIIASQRGNYTAQCKEYLQNAAALTRLEIFCCTYKSVSLKTIIDTVSSSPTVTYLSLHNFIVDHEAVCAIQNFLVGNSTVERFHLVECIWKEPGQAAWLGHLFTEDFGSVSERIAPWLSIIKRNRSLKELRLRLGDYSQAEFEAFFEELRNNGRIERILIEDFSSCGRKRIRHMCGASCGRRRNTSEHKEPEKMLVDCKPLCEIQLDCLPMDRFLSVIGNIVPCRHITVMKLVLNAARVQEKMQGALSAYLEHTTTLQELTVTFFAQHTDSPERVSTFQREFLHSLLLNNSLRKLCFDDCWSFKKNEGALLATILNKSQRISDFEITAPDACTDAVADTLVARGLKNYGLVRIRVHFGYLTRQWLTVMDMVRRNVGLIARAADFVTGGHDRLCAYAAERVASSTALLKKVCEIGRVSEADAATMIKVSIGKLEGMETFMRMSGVVRETVSCRELEIGQLQLDDIDEYSWCAVRKYLRFKDVVGQTSF